MRAMVSLLSCLHGSVELLEQVETNPQLHCQRKQQDATKNHLKQTSNCVKVKFQTRATRAKVIQTNTLQYLALISKVFKVPV